MISKNFYRSEFLFDIFCASIECFALIILWVEQRNSAHNCENRREIWPGHDGYSSMLSQIQPRNMLYKHQTRLCCRQDQQYDAMWHDVVDVLLFDPQIHKILWITKATFTDKPTDSVPLPSLRYSKYQVVILFPICIWTIAFWNFDINSRHLIYHSTCCTFLNGM